MEIDNVVGRRHVGPLEPHVVAVALAKAEQGQGDHWRDGSAEDQAVLCRLDGVGDKVPEEFRRRATQLVDEEQRRERDELGRVRVAKFHATDREERRSQEDLV